MPKNQTLNADLFLKGSLLGSIKGVLFDKDGTLTYSEDHLLFLGNLRIEESIKKFSTKEKDLRQSKRLKEMLTAAYGLTHNSLEPNGTLAVASRRQNLISTATVFCILGEHWPNAFKMANEIFNSAEFIEKENSLGIDRPLLPGAKNFLVSLKQAGIKCALISNDTTSGIKDFLKLNRLEETITHFWSAEHRPSKPDPGAVKGLCDQLGLNPSECALIGDADSDLTMARQSNINLILGYLAGWSKQPSLTEHQHLIHHWNDLTIEQNPKVPDSVVTP